MQIERRFIRGAQLRAKKDDKPGIEGVGAVYNQIYDNGYFFETVKPGAFDDVLAADPDVRCLFNHEPDNVLGRTKSKTLRLADSPDGLRFECDTDANTRIGSDVRAMIERGDVDGCSISFAVGEQVWRDEFDDKGSYVQSTREIVKFAALFDVGPVTFPAYEQTSVEARSAQWPGEVPAEIRSHVPSLRSLADAPRLGSLAANPADSANSAPKEKRSDTDCTCPCDSCQNGDCDGCDCGADCAGVNCANEECNCDQDLRMRVRMMRCTL